MAVIKVYKTNIFDEWLDKLKDRRARVIINKHLDRLADESFGDHKSVGSGIYEKRINYGQGIGFTAIKKVKLGFYFFVAVTNLHNNQTSKWQRR